MKIYKTAIIGTGLIANAHVKGCRMNPERVSLVAALDVDANKVKDFCANYGIPGAYTDLDELLEKEKPDFVQICTPPHLHAELSIRCLRAGTWVLCQKPMCASLNELDRVQAVEEETGLYCASNFQNRFGASCRHFKGIIEEGALGRPLVGICNTLWYRDHAYYDVPWRGKWSTELGGPTMGHGIHLMDMFLYLMGPWEDVTAQVGTLDRNIEVEDVSMALVRFRNGAMATIINSVLSPREETYLRLDFQKGTLEVPFHYEYINRDWRITLVDPCANKELAQRLRSFPDNNFNHIGSQIKSFVEDMDNNARPITSGQAARETIEFLTALYKSAFTGERVTSGSIGKGDPFYDKICGMDPRIHTVR